MSEDEAFARALQLSLSMNGAGDSSSVRKPTAPTTNNAQEDDDLALAQALAASEHEFNSVPPPKKTTCVMSWKSVLPSFSWTELIM